MTPEKQNLVNELTERLACVLLGEKLPLDIVDVATGEIIIPANRKIVKFLLNKYAKAELFNCGAEIDPSPVRNKLRQILAEFETEKKIKLCPLTVSPW